MKVTAVQPHMEQHHQAADGQQWRPLVEALCVDGHEEGKGNKFPCGVSRV